LRRSTIRQGWFVVIRLVYLLRRKPDQTLQSFQQYWREQHAPLVAGFQSSLRILKYVQVHRVVDAMEERASAARGGSMEGAYDGAAELWWESEDDLLAANRTPEGRAAGAELVADEARFIDLAQSPLWLAHEYPQVNPTPENVIARERSGVVKLHFALRHLPQLSRAEAQHYWRVQHGPLIRRQAEVAGILCYRQVHRYETPLEAALREARGTVAEPYTGHAEAWFDRTANRSGDEVRAAGRRAVEDERNFIDFTRSTIWFGKEHVIVDRM
jgi:uncharacterized protein (TIGR02118 family)